MALDVSQIGRIRDLRALGYSPSEIRRETGYSYPTIRKYLAIDDFSPKWLETRTGRSSLLEGFWAHMTDRSHERDLWVPSIHKAWPKGTARSEVNDRIAGINKICNRVAHHEHLFASAEYDWATLQSCRDAVSLFAQLEPVVCDCVYGGNITRCSVDNYLKENPAPCDVVVWRPRTQGA